jgi:hypothetical protein
VVAGFAPYGYTTHDLHRYYKGVQRQKYRRIIL